MFPHAFVTALAPISSNHNLLIIEDFPTAQQRKRAFKLEPYWTKHKDFESVIKQSWNQDEANIMCNIDSVKVKLEDWSKLRRIWKRDSS